MCDLRFDFFLTDNRKSEIVNQIENQKSEIANKKSCIPAAFFVLMTLSVRHL